MFSFRAINMAFDLNQKFYYKEQIVEFMLDLQNNGKLTSYRETRLENAISWNRQMQDEIDEILTTSLPIKKTMLFEHLEYIQTIFGFNRVEKDAVLKYVNDYNEAEYNDFESKALAKEEEFKKSHNYRLNHLEEHDVIFFENYTRKEKFRKFICLESSPKLIDTDLFYKYEEILENTVGTYVSILNRYINLYSSGKLGKIELETKIVHKQIKTKLTVKQMACLFRMLFEAGIFDTTIQDELQEFVAENFLAIKSKEKTAKKSLANNWKSPDNETINFCTGLLNEMQKKIKKF